MVKCLSTYLRNLKNFFSTYSKSRDSYAFFPVYRIDSIKQNEEENDYEVIAQIIGTSAIVKMKPEEILVNDELTSKFSPVDVRTLTYLGYLGINSPKYKILARRLSEKDNKIVFALHKKGSKNVEIKIASEISQNPEILKQLSQEDAHMVSYIAGTESMLKEKPEKEKFLKKKRH